MLKSRAIIADSPASTWVKGACRRGFRLGVCGRFRGGGRSERWVVALFERHRDSHTPLILRKQLKIIRIIGLFLGGWNIYSA